MVKIMFFSLCRVYESYCMVDSFQIQKNNSVIALLLSQLFSNVERLVGSELCIVASKVLLNIETGNRE